MEANADVDCRNCSARSFSNPRFTGQVVISNPLFCHLVFRTSGGKTGAMYYNCKEAMAREWRRNESGVDFFLGRRTAERLASTGMYFKTALGRVSALLFHDGPRETLAYENLSPSLSLCVCSKRARAIARSSG